MAMMLFLAVKIGEHATGAHIHVAAQSGVPHIGEMPHLASGSHMGALQFGISANVHSFFQDASPPDMGEWPGVTSVLQFTLDNVGGLSDHSFAEPGGEDLGP